MEKLLKENKEKLPAATAKEIEDAVQEVHQVREKGSADEVKAAMEQLEKASHKAAEELYKTAGAGAGAGRPGAGRAARRARRGEEEGQRRRRRVQAGLSAGARASGASPCRSDRRGRSRSGRPAAAAGGAAAASRRSAAPPARRPLAFPPARLTIRAPMQLTVLSRSASIYTTRRLVEAARARGVAARVVDPARGRDGARRRARGLLAAAPRSRAPTSSSRASGSPSTSTGSSVVNQLELMGVPVLNGAYGIAASRNKMRSLQLLAAARRARPAHRHGLRPLGPEGDGAARRAACRSS